MAYEFASDRFPDFAPLAGIAGCGAVESIMAGRVNDAKMVLKVAFELDPDLRLAALDHPGLEAIRWP